MHTGPNNPPQVGLKVQAIWYKLVIDLYLERAQTFLL